MATASQMIKEAYSLVGQPYLWGGNGETLEEIIINISGFVISAPDAASPGAPEILTFDTPGALREYMNNNRNPELDSDEQENFDAYSNYISTVLEYLGKL